MSPTFTQLIFLALMWTLYFVIHSALASLHVKNFVAQHFPRLAARYRFTYNVLAVALLAPPLWTMHTLSGEVLWAWSGAWTWFANACALLALGGFVWTTRYYDMRTFIGLQRDDARNNATTRDAAFVISPLHRVVRHPWYFLALIILWTRDMDAAHFVTALSATLYLAIGSLLEERKLEQEFGAAYREYRRLVPGLIPLPWRVLKRDALEQITKSRRIQTP